MSAISDAIAAAVHHHAAAASFRSLTERQERERDEAIRAAIAAGAAPLALMKAGLSPETIRDATKEATE